MRAACYARDTTSPAAYLKGAMLISVFFKISPFLSTTGSKHVYSPQRPQHARVYVRRARLQGVVAVPDLAAR